MASDPIAARYARAAFEAAKASQTLNETLEQLTLIGKLVRQHSELGQLMSNPHVDLEGKIGILERILEGSWSPLVLAFVRMVLRRERAEFLPEIAEALQAEVDADQGQLRVAVYSARPLPRELVARLQTQLEQREQKHVHLETKLAPELIGGAQVVMGHRVIDGSIQRQLDDLRQRLTSVRVY